MLYLKSLEIENVRCFGKKQIIDFTDSDGKISQWNVILGDNGTGKTTILRSIVSMLPSPDLLNQKPEINGISTNFIKHNWETNRFNFENKSKITLNISKSNKAFDNIEVIEKFHFDSSQEYIDKYKLVSFYDVKKLGKIFCFGYGANRKMAETNLSEESFNHVSETLFKDDALLQNSSEYLIRLDYEIAKNNSGLEEFNRVKELIIKILPKGVSDLKIVNTGRLQNEVQVKTDFGWVKLSELSLGYKTTIAWLLDFATNMIFYHSESKNPFEEPAILIIDEIDLHMHPSWQREIFDNLSNLFPKTQFIVTAHSPLIAQSALNANLILLKQNGDHIEVINEPKIVKNWRIDQILTSDLFGLKEARPKEFEDKLKRRRLLLKKEKLTAKEQKELNEINLEVNSMPIGETQSEIDAMDVLREIAEKLESYNKTDHD